MQSTSECFPACLFVWTDLHMWMGTFVSVMVACGVTHSYGDVIASVDWIWLALLANRRSAYSPASLHSAKAVTRTRFLQPDAEIRSDNLEWAFRSFCKWMCGEGGEITLPRNHLIMKIISCHGYQSSFMWLGGFMPACFVQQGQVGGGGCWLEQWSSFGKGMQHQHASTSHLTLVPEGDPCMNEWRASAPAFSQQCMNKWIKHEGKGVTRQLLLTALAQHDFILAWQRKTISCRRCAWLPVSCSPLQRKASTSWRFWFPAMRRGRSSGKEVRPSSSCRKRLEPPSNCQNPKTSTPVSDPSFSFRAARTVACISERVSVCVSLLRTRYGACMGVVSALLVATFVGMDVWTRWQWLTWSPEVNPCGQVDATSKSPQPLYPSFNRIVFI